MPSPRKGEPKSEFIPRCMGSAEARKTFPKSSQRAAFCYSQWRTKDNSVRVHGRGMRRLADALPCWHSNHHLHNNQRSLFRFDPTRTTMLRRQYETALVRRFREIQRLIREALIDDDVLGLTEDEPVASGFKLAAKARSPGKKAFKFARPEQKVSSFMDWLRQAESQEILEVQYGTPIRSAARRSWQNVYLQSAYQKGLSSAASSLKKQGVKVEDSFIQSAFLRPTHADRAGLIFTRAFTQLEGITDVMDQQLSQVLSQGIIEGVGARELAKRLTERVDKIGITRARRLARTETISAHAEASLNAYEEAEIEGVTVMAEFATAQDDKVCQQCQELEEKYNSDPISIDEAHGIIPVHPNCRCAWTPVVADPTGKVLR